MFGITVLSFLLVTISIHPRGLSSMVINNVGFSNLVKHVQETVQMISVLISVSKHRRNAHKVLFARHGN